MYQAWQRMYFSTKKESMYDKGSVFIMYVYSYTPLRFVKPKKESIAIISVCIKIRSKC